MKTEKLIPMDNDYIVMEQYRDQIQLLSGEKSEMIHWSSSNPLVARVDKNGVVRARKTGVSIITGELESGQYLYCTIYVMSYEILFPPVCSVQQGCEIKVNVYNNGISGMKKRKHILIYLVLPDQKEYLLADVAETKIIYCNKKDIERVIGKTHKEEKIYFSINIK